MHPWIDQKFLLENCELGNERSSYEKWVLYADNLGAQRTKQFVEKIQVKHFCLGDAWDDFMKRPTVHESSFAKGGCLAGVEPSSVVGIVVNDERAFVCVATKDTEWDNEDYFNKNFTGSPNFEYKVIKKRIVAVPVAAPDAASDAIPNDAPDEDSDEEGDGGSSSTGSTSSSSSDNEA